MHDFKILKNSRVAIAKHIEKLADSGYQGIAKLYSNTQIPFKKPKGGQLSDEQKQQLLGIVEKCPIHKLLSHATINITTHHQQ